MQPGDTLVNPRMIVEVLSEFTEAYDRGKKFEHDRAIESLTDYVLVSQDKVLAEHFSRQADGRRLYTAANKSTDSISIPALGCTLNLAEVYENVEALSARDA